MKKMEEGDEDCSLASTPAKKYKADRNPTTDDIQKEVPEGESCEGKISNDLEKLKKIVMETPEEEVAVVNVKMVIEMFENVNKEIGKLKVEKSNKTSIGQMCKTTVKNHIDKELNSTFTHYDEEIKSLKTDLQEVRTKNKLLNDVMQFNLGVMEDMASRMDSIELSNARRAAILTGLNTSVKKEEMRQQIASFLDSELKIQPNIDDVYQLGNRDPKPVIIIFNTAEDKRIVFQRKSVLGGIRNEDGGKFYLNDYLPAKINEKKQREWEIIKSAKAEPKQDESNKIEYVKGTLKIGPTPYKKKILPPSHMDLLKYKSAELDQIADIQVKKGSPVTKDGNTFIPYLVDAQDTQCISGAYTKLRLAHARAKHIVCAYSIPGEPKFLYTDACDDEDYGAGRAILEAMEASEMSSRAIFVVRHCGPQKLGQERMNCYIKAAQNVCREYPKNEILKKEQSLETIKRKPTVVNKHDGAQRNPNVRTYVSTGRSVVLRKARWQ